MKIPKTIKVGGFDWKVSFNDEVTAEGNCFGSTHHRTQKIYLENKETCSQDKVDQTLLHEILHAVWWQQGLTESEARQYEEFIVSSLSMGLYQVLKDNKLQF